MFLFRGIFVAEEFRLGDYRHAKYGMLRCCVRKEINHTGITVKVVDNDVGVQCVHNYVFRQFFGQSSLRSASLRDFLRFASICLARRGARLPAVRRSISSLSAIVRSVIRPGLIGFLSVCLLMECIIS